MTEIFAHRGARVAAPENTLPAFQTALEMQADGIELDVHCCQDGSIVVIHDFSVERTTDGHGAVSDLTLAELRTLDAGIRFGLEFAGTRIPTLEEVLDLVGDRCRVNIEIKTVDYRGGPEVDAVARIVAERNLYGQVIVSSFNPVALIKMRHVDERVRLGLLYYDALPDYLMDAWLSPLMRPDALHPHSRLVDSDFMERARLLHKAVNVWTVNDIDEARRLHALGVDIIISDVPDVMLAGLATQEQAM